MQMLVNVHVPRATQQLETFVPPALATRASASGVALITNVAALMDLFRLLPESRVHHASVETAVTVLQSAVIVGGACGVSATFSLVHRCGAHVNRVLEMMDSSVSPVAA